MDVSGHVLITVGRTSVRVASEQFCDIVLCGGKAVGNLGHSYTRKCKGNNSRILKGKIAGSASREQERRRGKAFTTHQLIRLAPKEKRNARRGEFLLANETTKIFRVSDLEVILIQNNG